MHRTERILRLLPALVFLLALTPPARALQTHVVEIGDGTSYDGALRIERDTEGAMTFDDARLTTPVALGSLLTTSGHLLTHDAGFNAALPIPADPGGNATLGQHLLDTAIHPDLDADTTVPGDWRFSGLPVFENGLEAPRGALGTPGLLYGQTTLRPHAAEFLHLPLDDNAATDAIEDRNARFTFSLRDATGTATSAAHTTTGLQGAAIAFDGIDDHIRGAASLDPLFLPGRDWTLSLWWRYPADPPAAIQYIFCWNAALPIGIFQANNMPGSGLPYVKVFIKDAAGNTPSHSSDSANGLVPGAWNHIVLRLAGEQFAFVLNGELKYSLISADHVADRRGGALYLGAYATGGYAARGAMDELRCYGRALSEAEIAALHKDGAGTAEPARFVTELGGALSTERLAIGGGFTTDTARLQVDEGAWCDGTAWISLSSRAAKTGIAPVAPAQALEVLRRLRVVEFAYKKKNPLRGRWLDPRGRPLEPGDAALDVLGGNDSARTEQLLQDGYRLSSAARVEDPAAPRRLGFVAEELRAVDPRLARPGGVAAIDVAAFNSAALQALLARLEALESRLDAEGAKTPTGE